jgi:glucose-6-phosphate isomerase
MLLTERPAWKALEAHYKDVPHHLRTCSPTTVRGEALTAKPRASTWTIPNRIAETIGLLSTWPKSGLRERAAMFRGDKINVTEKRAVLHTALRAPRDAAIMVDGHNVVADVYQVLDRMGDFADRVRDGRWLGFTGKRVRNVVNIGIGGSDLGPVMAYEALRTIAGGT